MRKFDVLIVGGGAAGLAAAVSARKEDKNISIAVIEKNDRVARKILATGNGRCNFTNVDISPDKYFGGRAFIGKVLSLFSYDDALSFFSSLGVLHRVEEGRVYPNSNMAASVADALRLYVNENNISVFTGKGVDKITPHDGGFMVDEFWAKKVIIACGGSAAPVYGTDGKAYGLLTAFGHKLNAPKPALVSIKTDISRIKGLKGVKVYACVRLKNGGESVATDTGEILFTDYGLSGIPVMQVSRFAEKGSVIYLDMLPSFSFEETVALIRSHVRSFPERMGEEAFSGIINKKLAVPMMKSSGIEKMNVKLKELSDKNILKCAEFLKELRLEVSGTSGFAAAQVTAGGIDTEGFDPYTLHSKLCEGLFAAGEILDCDGLCGGYNLHWAWATGVIAGRSASKSR